MLRILAAATALGLLIISQAQAWNEKDAAEFDRLVGERAMATFGKPPSDHPYKGVVPQSKLRQGGNPCPPGWKAQVVNVSTPEGRHGQWVARALCIDPRRTISRPPQVGTTLK